MRIRFFTHSTTEDNLNGIASGLNDVPLSAKGLEQAARNQLQCDELEFDAVYCSGLLRAKQSAEILFSGKPCVSDAALNEMNYGDLNGKSTADFSLDEFYCIENRFGNGENCLDVEARMRAFLGGKIQSTLCGSAPTKAAILQIVQAAR